MENQKNKMIKKSQIKIQEMAFMLVAVFIFFSLVLLFGFSVSYQNIVENANRINEERTLSAITNLANSPEFSCTGSRDNCVDADKVAAILNKQNYEKFWTFSSLQIIKINAINKTEKELIDCTFANYPNCDNFLIYKKDVGNERTVSSFVSLCRKDLLNGAVYEKCEIAKFIAGTEIEEVE